MSSGLTLTTKGVVEHLDKYIIGQDDTKKVIAIACRERLLVRNSKDPAFKYVRPNNILMTGPSGVGKSECARQLAELTQAPFTKCEIVNFTQSGYYGRDVKDILADLVQDAIRIAPTLYKDEVKDEYISNFNKEILEYLVGIDGAGIAKCLNTTVDKINFNDFNSWVKSDKNARLLVTLTQIREIANIPFNTNTAHDSIRNLFGSFDARQQHPCLTWVNNQKLILIGIMSKKRSEAELKEYLDILDAKLSKIKSIPKEHLETIKKIFVAANGEKRNKITTMVKKIPSARYVYINSALADYVNYDIVDIFRTTNDSRRDATPPKEYIQKLVEERGIVFIDEIDKIFMTDRGDNVGQAGVMRDLLPYLDGISAKVGVPMDDGEAGWRGMNRTQYEYYNINTAKILWIASGAFHVAKLNNVPAEILGRLPVHVRLHSLNAQHLRQIITKPVGSAIARVTAFLAAENIAFKITEDAITSFADLVYDCNQKGSDIGARRIVTVGAELFKDIIYNASGLVAKSITFTKKDVLSKRDQILGTVEPRPATVIKNDDENRKRFTAWLDKITKEANK